MSFLVCFMFLVAMARNSGSNVAPYFTAGEPDPAAMQTPIVRASNTARPHGINAFFNEMFSDDEEVRLEVKGGDTLASMLTSLGIAYPEIHEVSKAIDPISKVSDLRPNSDKLVVKVRRAEAEGKSKTELRSLEIVKSPAYRVKAERTSGGFRTTEERSDISAELVRAEGEISKGASLIEVATSAGIPYNIVDKFYEVFSFDVDFERDIYPGDRFQVMYEQLYSERGDYIGSGELVFASIYLNSRGREFKLYRHESDKGAVGYYDENGKSASKTLKKTPLNGARVSSRYGSRMHPILGYTRDHKGVDFAAPSGTPIPAAGSGTVVERGWKSGYGNYIKIKHNGTYSTAYGHMSSFKSGIRVGARVNQGQIVGFVGNTGLSTGAHLHYEIIKDGFQVNPLTVKLPSTRNIGEAEVAKFNSGRDRINMQFAVLNKDFNQFSNLLSLGGMIPANPARK
ncbi:MAG: M23 family metallopeptidase [Rickettsiales bacterium]|jgi:murein DD-endopeptidase MepM/ murein hydrolase activator NlpD|nr:M23 family metallopeptidase [Rickettsiales bacterium]